MSKTILCPFCFKKFENTDIMMQCQNDATKLSSDSGQVMVCPKEPDVQYSDHWGAGDQETKHIFRPSFGFMERMGWKMFQSKPCDKCGALSQRFVCPHCHNNLPPEMVEKGSEIISVVGGPASGKTTYIVALLHQLQKYSTKLGITITLQQYGRESKFYTTAMYKEMKKTLFDEHMTLPQTKKAKKAGVSDPWIVRLESKATHKAIYLVFYDTAGEDWGDAEKMRTLQYFKESSGVIVVFDALANPKVQKIMDKRGVVNMDRASDYMDTWNNLQNFEQSNKAIKLTERPFAFTFTKFDVIVDNADLLQCNVDAFVDEKGQFVQSTFVKTGQLSLNQIDSSSDAVRDYLKDDDVLGEAALADSVSATWGDHARFFGVSSLGQMADKMMSEGNDVRPLRVMDPLLWILHRLGGFGIPTDEVKK